VNPVRSAVSRLPYLLLAVAAVVFYRTATIEGGGDLLIYWKIAGRVLEGGPTYLPAADLPNAYKYPPWVLPVFLPLAALPFETARAAWALVSIAAMIASFAWVVARLKASPWAAFAALAATWGIWGSQFNHGQVGIPMLAGFLWLWHKDLPYLCRWRAANLALVSSIKIASVYPLLFFAGPLAAAIGARSGRRAGRGERGARGESLDPAASLGPWLRAAGIAVALAAALSLPSLWTGGGPGPLWRDWMAVARAEPTFNPAFERGRTNQGLPAAVARLVDPAAPHDRVEVFAALALGALIAVAWTRASRRLSAEESWAGWVAAFCVVHPLSWSRNFVLALPLLAVALDRGWRAWRPGRGAGEGARILPFALALAAALCAGPLTVNTGQQLGSEALASVLLALEHAGIKSIGVLLAAGAIYLARDSGVRGGHSAAVGAAPGAVPGTAGI
jgi:hypothetical protein